MTITYQAFDHVTGSYITPDGALDSIPIPYPSAQYALQAIMAMLRLNAFAAPNDVEIFTLINGKQVS